MSSQNSTSHSSLLRHKIGILGGGQLARMLCLKGHELGFEMFVLSTNKDDPAAQVTKNWLCGDPNQFSQQKKILQLCDVVTFESEFINTQKLQNSKVATKLQPNPQIIHSLQDRWTQKNAFIEAKLPTSDFVKVDCFDDLPPLSGDFSGRDFSGRDFSGRDFSGGYVLKARRFGYDGYGTFVVRSSKEIQNLKPLFNKKGHGFIAEKFQKFRRELAIVLVRSANGDLCTMPLVESFQHKSRCLWVKGPIAHPKINSLLGKLKKFMANSEYVGAMAFELFDLGDQLVINETAPRVHNSAHYSLDATDMDQFSLHLLAILGKKLPKLAPLKTDGFAMYNLLGGGHQTPKLASIPKIKLHWYGKKENREGRKMGHINCVDKTPSLALAKLKRARKEFQL